MSHKKILFIEMENEPGEVFANWLIEEDYDVKVLENLEEARLSITQEKFDVLLIDIDYPDMIGASLDFCRSLKSGACTSILPVVFLTYKKESKKIADAIEAGVDNFILKPFETDSFLDRMRTILKEFALREKGEKTLDLNYINYLVSLTRESDREDFFHLSQVIFNTLVLDKIKGIFGEPVTMAMIKRVQELTGDNYKFMKNIRFENGRLLMDGVDKASSGVPVKKIAMGFQNFVYEFLHIVKTLTSDVLMNRGGVRTHTD